MSIYTPAQAQEAVEVFRIVSGNRIELRALNPNPYPVTVEFEYEVENLEDPGNGRFTVLLNARNNQVVRQFQILDQNRPWRIDTKSRSTIGNLFSPTDKEYLYLLPFECCEAYRLHQGYEGRIQSGAPTHTGRLAYSLDFEMEEGTPVLASRKGVVAGLKSDSEEGGPDPGLANDGNYILILHNDGSVAVYAHLKPGGVNVAVGQPVERGDVIGYSGNTGFSSSPHLHFMVGRFSLDGVFHSFPVLYQSDEDTISEFEVGSDYQAG
ncbi:MAG: M23 family metallopeptidase [Balneolaceae bacterium]